MLRDKADNGGSADWPGRRTGPGIIAQDGHFWRHAGTVILRNLFSGQCYRLDCLRQHIRRGIRLGCHQRLIDILVGAGAPQHMKLHPERQAGKHQQPAQEQPCHPVGMTLTIIFFGQSGQNSKLSLTAQELNRTGRDRTRFQAGFGIAKIECANEFSRRPDMGCGVALSSLDAAPSMRCVG